MIRWLKNLFRPKCQHNKRFVLKQWFEADGTPMMYFNCWDCFYSDRGHVHGDPEQMRKDGWEKEVYGEPWNGPLPK